MLHSINSSAECSTSIVVVTHVVTLITSSSNLNQQQTIHAREKCTLREHLIYLDNFRGD